LKSASKIRPFLNLEVKHVLISLIRSLLELFNHWACVTKVRASHPPIIWSHLCPFPIAILSHNLLDVLVLGVIEGQPLLHAPYEALSYNKLPMPTFTQSDPNLAKRHWEAPNLLLDVKIIPAKHYIELPVLRPVSYEVALFVIFLAGFDEPNPVLCPLHRPAR